MFKSEYLLFRHPPLKIEPGKDPQGQSQTHQKTQER